MNLDLTIRLQAVLMMATVGLAGCMPNDSELGREGSSEEADADEDAEASELDRKTAALSGNISACSNEFISRYRFTYPDQFHGNMQAFSANLSASQRDWWNRTDCQGLVVDWLRGTSDGVGHNSEQAFITGITDPGFAPQDCSLLRVSRRIMTQWYGDSPGPMRVIADNDEVYGADCAYSFLAIPWLGSTGPNLGWFSRQTRMRAVVQGYYYTFPVPVSAYMQTDNHTTQESCPTHCCYTGQQYLSCL
jgi:hypothetical protein